MVFGMEASFHLSHAALWGNLGTSRNKGTSLWNSVPNSEELTVLPADPSTVLKHWIKTQYTDQNEWPDLIFFYQLLLLMKGKLLPLWHSVSNTSNGFITIFEKNIIMTQIKIYSTY